MRTKFLPTWSRLLPILLAAGFAGAAGCMGAVDDTASHEDDLEGAASEPESDAVDAGDAVDGGDAVDRGDAGSMLCTPGLFYFCRCADGEQGKKQCTPDGQSFSACACD